MTDQNVSFNFVAPYSIDECIKRLQEKHSPTIFTRNFLDVEIVQIARDEYKFNLRTRGKDIGRIRIEGKLRQQNENTTLIDAEMPIPSEKLYLLVNGMILVFAGTFSLLMAAEYEVSPAICLPLSLAVTLWGIILSDKTIQDKRAYLIQLFTKTLTKPDTHYVFPDKKNNFN